MDFCFYDGCMVVLFVLHIVGLSYCDPLWSSARMNIQIAESSISSFLDILGINYALQRNTTYTKFLIGWTQLSQKHLYLENNLIIERPNILDLSTEVWALTAILCAENDKKPPPPQASKIIAILGLLFN